MHAQSEVVTGAPWIRVIPIRLRVIGLGLSGRTDTALPTARNGSHRSHEPSNGSHPRSGGIPVDLVRWYLACRRSNPGFQDAHHEKYRRRHCTRRCWRTSHYRHALGPLRRTSLNVLFPTGLGSIGEGRAPVAQNRGSRAPWVTTPCPTQGVRYRGSIGLRPLLYLRRRAFARESSREPSPSTRQWRTMRHPSPPTLDRVIPGAVRRSS